MANISYVRAGTSCLPIVGPFVGLYNVLEVGGAMSSYYLLDSLERMAYRNSYLLSSQTGRLYAICGIVGDALSIATVIGLIALGIFNVAPGIIAVASLTFQAVVLSYNLYEHNKNITALQAT